MTSRGPLRNGLQLVGDIYHYQFLHNGKLMRGSTGCRIFDDAQRWLRRFRGKMELEGVGIRQVPSLRGLLQEWETVAAATNQAGEIDRMRSAITTHFSGLLQTPVDQLTTEKIQGALLEYLQGKGDGPGRQGHSAGGANALLMRLNTLIGWAIRCEYLRKKPYDVKRFKRQIQPRPVVRAANAGAFVEALQRLSRSRDRRLAVGLQLALGIRESEALGARWELFDLANRSLVAGRIEDGRFVTKGGEARQLPLPEWLFGWLSAHWIKAGKPKEGLLFPGPMDPEAKIPMPHSPGYTRALVRRVGADIGLPGLTPHRLRASFISSLVLEANVPLPQVQKMVGHKHIATTMRYVEGAEQHTDALVSLDNLRRLNSDSVLKSVNSYNSRASKKRKKAS